VRPLWLAGGLLALAGCASEPPPVVVLPRQVTAEAPPQEGLWLGLRAQAEHLSPVGHGASMAWVPAAWVVGDGATVSVGDDLVRYDTESLSAMDAQDAFSIDRDAKRKQLDLLRSDSDIASLQSRIRQLQARREVVAAELDAASVIDSQQVRIAELQLADANTEHAAALRRRQALDRLVAAGAPVSGAELARAREEEVRSRTARAAPAVNLELARMPAARSTVRRLQLTLADIEAQLGASPEEGLEAELRTASERRARRLLDREQGRGSWRLRRHEEILKILENPVMRSRAAGVAQLRDADVKVGAKLAKDISCVFVLGPEGLAALVSIPEQMRPLVAEGARIALRSPAFGTSAVLGSIASVSASPETASDGQRIFPARARLVDPPAAIRPGMSVQCSLAVDAGPGASIIPSYCIADRASPEITLADGSVRRLAGWPVGSWFVALSGLAPGDRVQVPDNAARSERVRLTALVEPAKFVPVRLRSWDWEVLELLPEGRMVRSGERIARLIKVESWRSAEQIRSEAELNLAQGRLDLIISQLSATDERAGARANWVRAQLSRERTQLEAWVGRNAYDAVAQARTEAALATAVVGHERAGRELAAAVEERAAGGISDNALRQSRLALDKAATSLARARLDAAERELGTSWVELRSLDDAVLSAAEDEAAKRELAILASETFRARIAGAAARFDGTRRWVDGNLRNLADEELFAPADGRLVYARSWDGPPRPGRRLESWEPFLVAEGDGRRATFEVPARLFGRVAAGAKVRITGSGASEGLEATVVSVANAFLPPSSFADEVALGRTLGVEERIFQVTVSFTPAKPAQLPPGSTVYVDL
jgi:hypothetical protein